MYEPLPERTEAAARVCVQAAIRVHRELGPGLPESAYEHCLSFELHQRAVPTQRQLQLPIRYGGHELDAGYRLDLVVDECLIVEIKAIDALAPIHEAQVLTYLKLSGLRLGLLINFNVKLLKDGIRRLIL